MKSYLLYEEQVKRIDDIYKQNKTIIRIINKGSQTTSILMNKMQFLSRFKTRELKAKGKKEESLFKQSVVP